NKFISASDSNSSPSSLTNPDTIRIDALSYNSTTGILTLNLTLRDSSGNEDGNGTPINSMLNNNTETDGEVVITMQIPVSNVTSRTL
ncbi:MAG: hypothetical protein NZ516_09520, partial [Raineya sp.]|nr:hypothetical protein [Raineya sp.]